MADKFNYKYSAPTQDERKTVISIRNQYLPKDSHTEKIEKIKNLDNKVKSIPMIIGLTSGVVGLLVFGFGLTLILEWEQYLIGIVIMIIGSIFMIIANPLFIFSHKKLKNKYSEEILQLSIEILNEEDKKTE